MSIPPCSHHCQRGRYSWLGFSWRKFSTWEMIVSEKYSCLQIQRSGTHPWITLVQSLHSRRQALDVSYTMLCGLEREILQGGLPSFIGRARKPITKRIIRTLRSADLVTWLVWTESLWLFSLSLDLSGISRWNVYSRWWISWSLMVSLIDICPK